jgi:hypothetical protein
MRDFDVYFSLKVRKPKPKHGAECCMYMDHMCNRLVSLSSI